MRLLFREISGKAKSAANSKAIGKIFNAAIDLPEQQSH